MKTTTLKTLHLATCLALLVFPAAVSAQLLGGGYNPRSQVLADMSKNGYTETVADMEVKVLGGSVVFRRTLQGGNWLFNQRWDPLVSKSGCGPVTITRAGRYDYVLSGTAETTLNGVPRTQAIYGYQLDRRIVALVPEGADAPSVFAGGGGSGGGGGLCVDNPLDYDEYRWEDRYGNWIEYDSNGRAVRYGDRNDVQVSFSYDGNGRRNGVFDHHGTQVLFYTYQSYGGTVRLASIRDYSGREVSYTWSADGARIELVNDVRGNDWQYVYADNRLQRVVDPEGRQKLISYNTYGGVESVLMAEPGADTGVGTSFLYDYDDDSGEFTATEASSGGRVSTVVFDREGYVVREELNGTTLFNISIEQEGRKRAVIDQGGNRTEATFDERNNPTLITYADGTTQRINGYTPFSGPREIVDQLGVRTVLEYDANGNLVRATEAAGTPAERVTEYEYDTFGQVVVLRSVADADTVERTFGFDYDEWGNLTTVTDPFLNQSVYTHDVMGNELTHQDRRNHTWTATYDAAGNLLSYEDPLANRAQMLYDGTGNLVRVIDPALFETDLEYDARGNLVAIVDHLDGRVEYTYDDNNLPVQLKDASGRTAALGHDPAMRMRLATDGVGNQTVYDYLDKSDSANGNYFQINRILYPTYSTTLTYDRLGRVVTSTDDLGNGELLQTSLSYDAAGRLTAVTDPRNLTTHLTRDPRGRVTQIRDQIDAVISMRFDDRDNLIELTDPRSNPTQFEYDLLDRLEAEVKPLGQRSDYGYDEESNLLYVDDANGQRIAYTYDAAGRNDTITHYRDNQNLTTPDRSHTFNYDSRSFLESWNDGVVSGARTYDALGRLASETIDYGAFSLGYSYTYNANGTVDTFTDADGTAYRYVYDGDNKPTALLIPGVGSVAVNDFNWLAPASVSLPGGTRQDHAQTGFLESAGMSVSDPSGTVLSARTLTYDASRNVSTKNTESGDNAYDYDDANRLIAATRSAQSDKAYTYDLMGNRLTLDGSSVAWVYDDNNRLTSTPTTAYVYDENGNVTSAIENGVVTNFIYDVANRLERVEDLQGNVIASYGYDAFDRRIWKEVGGTRTYYLYSPAGLIGEYSDTGAQLKAYGYMPGGTWSTDPVYMKTAGAYHFYHNDHLGTPFMLTDQSGAVTWRAEAQPFGDTQVTTEVVVNNLRFPGQYYDAETGLHYNFRRYYDPATGRYITEDPIGFFGGIDQYGYAYQNPNTVFDPTGEWIPIAGLAARAALGWLARSAVTRLLGRALANRALRAVGKVLGAQAAMELLLDPCIPWTDKAKQLALDLVVDRATGVLKRIPLIGRYFGGGNSPRMSVSADGPKKRGPKTDPNAPHNRTIREQGDLIEDQGGTIIAGGGRKSERLVPTPGGHKDGRRPDILYEDADGTLRGRQVGRTRVDGSPVLREEEALSDLNDRGGLPTDFVPYDDD